MKSPMSSESEVECASKVETNLAKPSSCIIKNENKISTNLQQHTVKEEKNISRTCKLTFHPTIPVVEHNLNDHLQSLTMMNNNKTLTTPLGKMYFKSIFFKL